MSSKRILSEMFLVGLPAINRVNEDDEIDRINKQLSGAQSVAGKGGPPAKGNPEHQDVQNSLNRSKSVFKKEAAGTTGGLTVSGDKETLAALQECLQEAEHSAADPDMAHWAGAAWKAVAAGIRGSGDVTLPRFEQAPEELMPDEEPEEGDF